VNSVAGVPRSGTEVTETDANRGIVDVAAEPLPVDQRVALERSRDLEVSRLGTRIVRPIRPVRWMVSAVSYRERHDLDGVMRVIAT
jgi:hypothetical protein